MNKKLIQIVPMPYEVLSLNYCSDPKESPATQVVHFLGLFDDGSTAFIGIGANGGHWLIPRDKYNGIEQTGV